MTIFYITSHISNTSQEAASGFPLNTPMTLQTHVPAIPTEQFSSLPMLSQWFLQPGTSLLSLHHFAILSPSFPSTLHPAEEHLLLCCFRDWLHLIKLSTFPLSSYSALRLTRFYFRTESHPGKSCTFQATITNLIKDNILNCIINRGEQIRALFCFSLDNITA